jgi:SRSO17 transposase
MEINEMKAIKNNLDDFVKEFADCIKTRPSREYFQIYINGQVSNLERKSVEPIALEAGIPPRNLQEFLAIKRWNQEAVKNRVKQIILRDHYDEEAIGVIDETGCPKKGKDTVGVGRQYCGATGKVDNCVVSVHLGYVSGEFHALIDSDLYLPQTWLEDKDLRDKAQIPEGTTFRTKLEIALCMLKKAVGEDVPLHLKMPFKFLTADELYGRAIEFRKGVSALKLKYVVEVPKNLRGWTKKPKTITLQDDKKENSIIIQRRLDSPEPGRVDQLWNRGGPSWQVYHIKDTTEGPVVWEVRHSKFYVCHEGLPAEDVRLMIARNVLTGEFKYFLSNDCSDTPVEKLLRIAFNRWHIERLFEDAKGQVGFDHFEVRRYPAVMRHMIISMVSELFLMKETLKLREKKSFMESKAS